jgi:hypothetical protein
MPITLLTSGGQEVKLELDVTIIERCLAKLLNIEALERKFNIPFTTQAPRLTLKNGDIVPVLGRRETGYSGYVVYDLTEPPSRERTIMGVNPGDYQTYCYYPGLRDELVTQEAPVDVEAGSAVEAGSPPLLEVVFDAINTYLEPRFPRPQVGGAAAQALEGWGNKSEDEKRAVRRQFWKSEAAGEVEKESSSLASDVESYVESDDESHVESDNESYVGSDNKSYVPSDIEGSKTEVEDGGEVQKMKTTWIDMVD